jgi:hypothetical protein
MVALSGTHTITGSIDATYAIAKAVVHYSVQKSSDYFPGDEQLPQQFSLSPVSGMDHLDIQYGTSLCSSGWGPKGEINSSLTPWYNRRLWDATTDVEVSKTETVYTFKVKESDLARIKDPLAEDQFKNYNWDENNADFLLADSYKGCLGTTPYINNAWRIYWMNGPYNMEDEDDVTASDKLKLFCNQVGIEIRTGGDIYKPVWDNEGKSVILSSYDENRHSW